MCNRIAGKAAIERVIADLGNLWGHKIQIRVGKYDKMHTSEWSIWSIVIQNEKYSGVFNSIASSYWSVIAVWESIHRWWHYSDKWDWWRNNGAADKAGQSETCCKGEFLFECFAALIYWMLQHRILAARLSEQPFVVVLLCVCIFSVPLLFASQCLSIMFLCHPVIYPSLCYSCSIFDMRWWILIAI